jgi:DNA polymerase I-like protein with 3'-5' exonuclease and polymerase domains
MLSAPHLPRIDAPLRGALAAANAQGARFWVRGAEIATNATTALTPGQIACLWQYAVDERPYLDLLDQLGVTVCLIETRERLRAAIRQIEFDKRAYGRVVGIDLETVPHASYATPRPPLMFTKFGALAARQPTLRSPELLDSHAARVATMQLYAGGNTAFVFRGEALALLVRSHWLRRQSLTAHNAAFEVKFLLAATLGCHSEPRRLSRGEIYCTLQSSALLLGYGYDPEPRSLRAVTKQVLGLQITKDYATSDWSAPVLSAGQLAYAGSDAVLTRRIHLSQVSQLAQCGRQRAYDLQRGCIPAVATMEHRGLGFDPAQHMEQVAQWERDRASALVAFLEATGQPAPRKRSELAAWIANVLPPGARWPRTESGTELSTAERHLKRLAAIPAAHPLLKLARLDKLISAFGTRLLTMVSPATGRLHAHFMIAGAKSGRFTCSKPNLQQLPASKAPGFKRVIVRAPGYQLIGADWNQIEMRAAGWLAREPALYDLFDQGLDLHRETAATIARISRDEVSKELRQRAKCISFGVTYGMQAPSLVEYAYDSFDVVMTQLEAQRALDRIALAFPRLHQWKHQHYLLCQRRGYVEIGCGRVVKAEWEAGKSLWFALCCNLPIQGICADAMMRAIQLTNRRLREARLNAFLVATVHDELLIEAHESDVKATAEILQGAMTDAFQMTFPGFPTVNLVEVKTGASWAELKA